MIATIMMDLEQGGSMMIIVEGGKDDKVHIYILIKEDIVIST